ncbi:MAG: 6-phosphogluconolactonase, partial [Bacteroidota bacterium]
MRTAPDLHISVDGPAVARAFADYLVEKLHEKGEGPLFLALSGGSTPKLLFRLLAEVYKERIDWSRLHFFWGDERCVPHDDPESNFGVVKELLFDHVPVVWSQVHAVQTDLSPEEAARAYTETMVRVLPQNSDGLPIIDVNMLGMGGDGHTASIFPVNMDELLTSKEICAVATHPESGQKRVTMTGP